MTQIMTELSDSEVASLATACRTAAEVYSEHAQTFRVLEKEPEAEPDAVIALRGDGAARIAAQFEAQAGEALAFAEMLEQAEAVSVARAVKGA